MLLTYNTGLQYSGGSVVGFHGAYKRSSGIQTVTYASYNDYSDREGDIAIYTHEIGELLDDPFDGIVRDRGANRTPAWGHVGQESGCSKILEVGDPLTSTTFSLRVRGFTYHPQDLAFFSWFFRTQSIGTGGKYSFNGTFTGFQGLCTGETR